MFNITITVRNIEEILSIYDSIEFMRYTGDDIPDNTTSLTLYTTVSGTDQINSVINTNSVLLQNKYNQYYLTDPIGSYSSWYISRYTNTVNATTSAWSEPFIASDSDVLYNPLYPSEIEYTNADKQVIRQIRNLIGDPVRLVRDFGEENLSCLQADNKVYMFLDYGWPCSINMFGTQYTELNNPIVNGYKFLKFKSTLNTSLVNVNGLSASIDIWWYTFRNSDRQIMTAYDECLRPPPLNSTNCTTSIYLLQTAYNILVNETWEYVSEDGVQITDDKDSYNPSPGLTMRDKLLSRLKQQLDDAIKANRLLGISGVLID